MHFRVLLFVFSAQVLSFGIVSDVSAGDLYRFYSPVYQGHFYTSSEDERDSLIADDPNWDYEAVAYLVSEPGNTTEVYRFWSPVFQHHFYTVSAEERDALIETDPNWDYEGVAFLVSGSGSPVYRFWSEIFNAHFYTASESEKDSLEESNPDWSYEGIGWYVNTAIAEEVVSSDSQVEETIEEHVIEEEGEEEILDTEAPVIVLVGAETLEHAVSTPYTDPGSTVTDNVDANIEATVLGADFDTSIPGDYIIRFSAIDAAGNDASEVTRTVTVVVEEEVVQSDQKELLSFSFETANDQIPFSVVGIVEPSSVDLFVPSSANAQTLVPTFSVSDDAMVMVNGSEITSGVSAVDFSQTTTFTVQAEDGSQKAYVVNVTSAFTDLDANISEMMGTYNIPGLQVAITKDEKLVYIESYGVTDTSTDESVEDDSLFRIASISKPITAVAILKLAQEGALDLDDTVFGVGSIFGTQYGTTPYDADMEDITIRHLLDHTSGWQNAPYDPMLGYPERTHAEIITYMLDERSLVTTPGANYYYSNVGYSILGRVIEEVSGDSYTEYVESEVLVPSGISDMVIAKNSLAERYAKEVRYYSQESYSPYVYDVERMDSHGGWIASATDLARFLVHVDRNSGKTDILNQSITNGTYFDYYTWYHSGSLPGTSSVIKRLDNEYGFVVLANTRTLPVSDIIDEMQAVVEQEISARSQWPSFDLF